MPNALLNSSSFSVHSHLDPTACLELVTCCFSSSTAQTHCGMEIKARAAFALFGGMCLQPCAGFPLLLESGGMVRHVNRRHSPPSGCGPGFWLKTLIHGCCLSLEASKLEQMFNIIPLSYVLK